MPEVTLTPPTAVDSAELGRICFEAFDDISRKHGFVFEMPGVEFAQGLITHLIADERVYGTAARADGELAGSNFLSHGDDVAGLGPITVDPSRQGLGIGRMLMEDVLAFAQTESIEMVRLVQEAFNMTSMSLYTSLGFDTKVPLGLFDLHPADAPSDTVRPLTPADFDAADGLCREVYRVSRRGDIEAPGMAGMPSLVSERGGRFRGYLTPGIIGHGVAETEEDMIAMLGELARLSPMPVVQFLPLTSGSLMRKALAAGHRLRKMMNLMAIGPYEEPDGVWAPSVMF